MSSIPAVQISNTLQQAEANKTKIAYAVAGKQLQATKQAGEAAVELIAQAAKVASPSSGNGLDLTA